MNSPRFVNQILQQENQIDHVLVLKDAYLIPSVCLSSFHSPNASSDEQRQHIGNDQRIKDLLREDRILSHLGQPNRVALAAHQTGLWQFPDPVTNKREISESQLINERLLTLAETDPGDCSNPRCPFHADRWPLPSSASHP